MPYKDNEKQKAYHRRLYHANKKKYMAKARVRRLKVRAEVQQIKESTPCADCGKYYPYYVMDPDHVRGKNRRISMMVTSGDSFNTILKELSLCDIVCANCHRARTWKRMQKFPPTK